jgi:hypothetical protein
MTSSQRHTLRHLEGRQVGVALRDGSRIDDCQLVSAGRKGTRTVWVFANGADTFVGLDEVVDIWEVLASTTARAA